jgi:hypothetical protein
MWMPLASWPSTVCAVLAALLHWADGFSEPTNVHFLFRDETLTKPPFLRLFYSQYVSVVMNLPLMDWPLRVFIANELGNLT